MANWDGEILVALEPRKQEAIIIQDREERRHISPDEFYAGAYSLEIMPGGRAAIPAVADAGTRVVSAWIFSPPGGQVRFRFMDRDGVSVFDEAWSSASGGWEFLSIGNSGIAKGVYIAEIANFSPPDGDSRAFVDHLEIA
jgi:hypothetical protein